MFSVPYTHTHTHTHTGHPPPDQDEEPEKQNQNEWAWLPLLAIFTTLAYTLSPKSDSIPEVSFPFFLQHMLNAGEVEWRCCN